MCIISGLNGGDFMRRNVRGWVRLTLVVTLLVVAAVPAALATEPYHEIIVNIPAFSLHLYQDGLPAATYPIGVGRVVNPSQLGSTEVINKVEYPTYYPPDWYSQGLQPIPPGPENPVGTRWLGLGFKGYGIHGTNAPNSIGTAASAGCIRMNNEDVEALAQLIGVGTKVTFTYETVETWLDPVTRRPFLRVHRDIYRQGTNTLTRALDALEQVGVSREAVDEQALGAILGEAAGEARPVPTSVPLFLDDQQARTGAIFFGGRLLVSVESVAALTQDEVYVSNQGEQARLWVSGREVSGIFWIGQRPYVSVETVADALGLALLTAGVQGIHLERVRVVDAQGRDLGLRPYLTRSGLFLPVQELSQQFGVTATWDARLAGVRLGETVAFGAEVIGSKAYLPYDRLAEHLGVQITWRPQQATAVLRPLYVEIDSSNVGEGLIHGDQLYVPLRPITDALDYTLGWNQSERKAYVQGVPIAGTVRGGRLFASLDALDEVIPAFRYEWDKEALRLNLHLGGAADDVNDRRFDGR